MSSITFKNVGQGDSIILEWEDEGKAKIGIVDCNLYQNKNPILEYLIARSVSEIEFIVLSHYHIDHYSGFSEVFDYCKRNKIRINAFYHTITAQTTEIYNKIFTSKRVETSNSKFLDNLDSLGNLLVEETPTHRKVEDHILSKNLCLSFLAPDGSLYRKLAKQIARKVALKTFTEADINNISTIILLQSSNKGILLTSDAPKVCFWILKGRIQVDIFLAQIPHHGSIKSYYEPFWRDLARIKKCPIVFSVGDEPKDKLPNKETVASVDRLGYDIHSTNLVYGIKEHFFGTNNNYDHIKAKSNYLDYFSKLNKVQVESNALNSNLTGDQKFEFD